MKKTPEEVAEQMPVTPEIPAEVTAEAPTEEMPVEPTEPTEPTKGETGNELEELRAYKAQMEEANQKIMDVLDAEPVLAKIIQDISMGASFREAIARHIDPEELTAQEGDPDFEAWEKNRTARTDEMGKRKEFTDKMAANQEMTLAEIREFAAETGKTQEQMVEFMGRIDELFSNVYAGLIDRKTLALLEKAITADEAVAEAKEEGVIEGRNAKIKEKIVPEKIGDGLPKIAASEDMSAPEAPKKLGYIEKLKS